MGDGDPGVEHLVAERLDVVRSDPRCAEPGSDLRRFQLAGHRPFEGLDVRCPPRLRRSGRCVERGSRRLQLLADVAGQVGRRRHQGPGLRVVEHEGAQLVPCPFGGDPQEFGDPLARHHAVLVEARRHGVHRCLHPPPASRWGDEPLGEDRCGLRSPGVLVEHLQRGDERPVGVEAPEPAHRRERPSLPLLARLGVALAGPDHPEPVERPVVAPVGVVPLAQHGLRGREVVVVAALQLDGEDLAGGVT